MISFATSATSQTDYIHAPRPARRTKGSGHHQHPWSLHISWTAAGQTTYLNATQERPAFLRTDPSTSTAGCTDGSPPAPFESRGKELPSSEEVGEPEGSGSSPGQSAGPPVHSFVACGSFPTRAAISPEAQPPTRLACSTV